MSTNPDKNSMAIYGAREDVLQLRDRLVAMLPGGKKMSKAEALTLAQIAVSHGLDPYNGEVWFIPGSGVMVGIKGLRKSARRQIEKEGGDKASYWTQFERITRPSDYGSADTDIVYVCHMRDSVTMANHTKYMKEYIDMGFDGKEAREMCGGPPVTIGLGVVTKDQKTKMNKTQCAMKRAEADALKKRFDVEFLKFDVEHDEDPDMDVSYVGFDEAAGEDFVEGEVVEKETEPEGTVGNQEAVKIRQEVTSLINKHSQKEASKQFRGMLAGAMKRLLGTDENRYIVSEFLFGVKSTKELSGGQVYAMNEWVSCQKPEVAEERMGVLLQGVREIEE